MGIQQQQEIENKTRVMWKWLKSYRCMGKLYNLLIQNDSLFDLFQLTLRHLQKISKSQIYINRTILSSGAANEFEYFLWFERVLIFFFQKFFSPDFMSLKYGHVILLSANFIWYSIGCGLCITTYGIYPYFWTEDLILLENSIIIFHIHDQTQTLSNHKISLTGCASKKKETNLKHAAWSMHTYSICFDVGAKTAVYLVRKYTNWCLKCTLFGLNFSIIQTFSQFPLFVHSFFNPCIYCCCFFILFFSLSQIKVRKKREMNLMGCYFR